MIGPSNSYFINSFNRMLVKFLFLTPKKKLQIKIKRSKKKNKIIPSMVVEGRGGGEVSPQPWSQPP